jgi:hypothetical protein
MWMANQRRGMRSGMVRLFEQPFQPPHWSYDFTRFDAPRQSRVPDQLLR